MAGFRDKDSQLVPEADPPLGQSSSREESVHGREVPDENRNVKSKGKNAAKMENKCANCSFDFSSSSSPSRTKVLDVVVPSQVSPGLSVSNSAPQTVKVKDAFEFVFNVKTQDGQAEVPVCSECAQYLAGVYGLVSKLSQLRTADSYFGKRIKHQQDLIARKSETGKKTAGVKKAKAGRPSVPASKGNQYKTKKGKATKAAAARPSPATATPKTPKAPAKRRPKGPDAAIPSNIRDFLDPRPSRNAKLTAMVLMNNSFDLSGPATTKSTPKSSPPATAAPEVKDVKKPAPKQQRKKKAEEALAGPPAKKLKTSSEQAVATPKPVPKPRGKKAAATAIEVPTPAPTVKTPKTKTPRPESAKKPGRKSAKKDKSELIVSGGPAPSTSAAEVKKGKGGKKGKGTSLDEAIAASKLSSELKIPSVPLPSVVAAKPAAKAKKEKAPKKPKIMLSKATSTKRTVQSDEDSATEVTAVTPPTVNEKKETKKKPKKSQGQSATGELALDLSLKIPQVPAPGSAKSETPKAKKSKSKKVSETLLSPETQPVTSQAAKPSPAVDTKKEQKPKKPKVAKVADSSTTTQEGTPPVSEPKKPKKLKNSESKLDVSSASASSTAPGEATSVGSKATSKSFICNACGKDFTARWNLRRHDLLVHELPTTSPFTCVVCSQEFPARKALLEHRMSGPCAGGSSQQTSSKPAAATPNAGSSGPPPKKQKKEGAAKEPKGSKKAPAQPKGSAKQAKGTPKESKAQIVEKPPQKEKKQRKRKVDMEDGQKPPKKSKKSASNIMNAGSKNIPTNVMSGTDGGLNAVSQSPASGSALPDQNGPIDTTKTSGEAGSARSGPSVGTSSTVNNAESVTSAPARGDTAGVGA